MYTVNHDVLDSVALFVSHGSRASYLDGVLLRFCMGCELLQGFSNETKDASVGSAKGITVKVAWCRTF
ncbi:uncharacterized protein CCR75_005996 [Bremia lactucae]|uniref:Uncharacterized protein n=1 Tax=Bremia lactucae TaxID=4779 RepID=A0A976FRG5_BRELC|nr:hypothetical protein CCR75_005996 [Bremia lactucae]